MISPDVEVDSGRLGAPSTWMETGWLRRHRPPLSVLSGELERSRCTSTPMQRRRGDLLPRSRRRFRRSTAVSAMRSRCSVTSWQSVSPIASVGATSRGVCSCSNTMPSGTGDNSVARSSVASSLRRVRRVGGLSARRCTRRRFARLRRRRRRCDRRHVPASFDGTVWNVVTVDEGDAPGDEFGYSVALPTGFSRFVPDVACDRSARCRAG